MHTLAIPEQKCKPDSTMLGRNGSESEKYGNSHRCKPREDILHWKAPDKREWHHHRHQKVKMKWYVLKAQHGTAMADHVVELLCRLVIAELDTSLETSPVVGRGGHSCNTIVFYQYPCFSETPNSSFDQENIHQGGGELWSWEVGRALKDLPLKLKWYRNQTIGSSV